MQDTIIKGTGDSRTLGSVPNFLEVFPSYQAFGQGLVSGLVPIDLGPLNPLGCLKIGTGYTKAEVLPAELQGILNLSDFATPADAFKALYRNIYGSDETIYRWLRTRPKYVEMQTSIPKNTIIKTVSSADSLITIQRSNSVSVDPSTGSVTLNNPEQATHTYTQWCDDYPSYVDSKYFKVEDNSTIYKGVQFSRLTNNFNGTYRLGIGGNYGESSVVTGTPSTTEQITEIVTSTDPNAYPVAGDGWTYTELAPSPTMPPCARIQIGSYIGTGTYGANNPNSLTFEFEPKLLIIPFADYFASSQTTQIVDFIVNKDYSWLILTDNLPTSPGKAYGLGYNSYAYAYVSADRKTVYWHTTSSNTTNGAYFQFNNPNLQYFYLAIG